ncbi:MAG: 16S rRNA (cytosine(1402)-N(4))-methyltransferase RsmH [Patescibacteria group bacterium]|jgi:16S rRNA (cytosine1402-N4)-methyltransferase
MPNVHVPVLLQEVMAGLGPQAGQLIVDGTLGGGGYTLAIAAAGAKVLAIDLDQSAIEEFKINKEYQKFKKQITLASGNFADLKSLCHENGFNPINGLVLDLGLSSNQLADPERGFSFQSEGSLDLRFNPAASPLTAFEIINSYKTEELQQIFAEFGEETLARPISQKIDEMRQSAKISTPKELAEIVSGVYHRHFKKPSRLHPATKVFQALRIAVNGELDNLMAVLPAALELLTPGGRLAVVSFHSLEDRIVKNFFRTAARDCICPVEAPVCQCHHTPELKILTKRPLTASAEEIQANPRARSAKLRVAEKI